MKRGVQTGEDGDSVEVKVRPRRLSGSFALPVRMAISVGGGVAAVLLVTLWVRSYWRWDSVSYYCIGAGSGQGTVVLAFDSRGQDGWLWTSSSYENDIEESARPLSTRAFEWKAEPGSFAVFIAHWLLLVPVVVLTAAPWMRWRFSVRTLLIAMTLVAIFLGMVAWLTH